MIAWRAAKFKVFAVACGVLPCCCTNRASGGALCVSVGRQGRGCRRDCGTVAQSKIAVGLLGSIFEKEGKAAKGIKKGRLAYEFPDCRSDLARAHSCIAPRSRGRRRGQRAAVSVIFGVGSPVDDRAALWLSRLGRREQLFPPGLRGVRMHLAMPRRTGCERGGPLSITR